jgi:hypothetical protein
MNGTEAEPSAGEKLRSDEHKVETAKWVLGNCKAETPVYRSASRVIAAYLVGKPLPSPRDPVELSEADV